jgi:dihydrofolate synthase/folylpolyglutamate synthase
MVTGRFSDSDAIFEYLMRYVNVEKGQATVFKLDRMRALASALGDPHLGRLTIHVAGSKGKGSVSTMCARILDASGPQGRPLHLAASHPLEGTDSLRLGPY